MLSLGVNDWNWNWNWEMEWGFGRGRHSSFLLIFSFSSFLLFPNSNLLTSCKVLSEQTYNPKKDQYVG